MSRPYRILVTGSRDWQDVAALDAALSTRVFRHLPAVIVHGACPTGADYQAAQFAREFAHMGITEEAHPANWAVNGRRAGFIRNQYMVNLGADICLAFIKDGSRGASHTAALAEAAGIPTRRYTA